MLASVKSTQVTTNLVRTPMVSVLPKAGFFLLFNLIPHSPDGFYKARLSGRLAELFTESADVSHDRIVVIEKLFAPDGLEELFRGDDLSLIHI